LSFAGFTKETELSEEEVLRELDQKLRRLSVDGLWSRASEADMATYSQDPRTTVLPHVWKWPALYEAIQTVANMHGLDGKAERRVLRLINPAYQDEKNRRQRTTTHTMLVTLQLLKPGEVAHDHRHNFAAFRFILKGTGAYTVVEGEKIPMQEGDLILTPSMTWHGHRNGGEPVVWLDGLDNPLLFLLQAITWEAFPGGLQPIKQLSEHTAPRIGATRPVWENPRSIRAITCTTNGTILTRSSKISAVGREAPSMAWRWNTLIRKAVIRCRRYPAPFRCCAREKLPRHTDTIAAPSTTPFAETARRPLTVESSNGNREIASSCRCGAGTATKIAPKTEKLFSSR
jgi:quercetin dioxygenase-like cupin family protein